MQLRTEGLRPYLMGKVLAGTNSCRLLEKVLWQCCADLHKACKWAISNSLAGKCWNTSCGGGKLCFAIRSFPVGLHRLWKHMCSKFTFLILHIWTLQLLWLSLRLFHKICNIQASICNTRSFYLTSWLTKDNAILTAQWVSVQEPCRTHTFICNSIIIIIYEAGCCQHLQSVCKQCAHS